jgi:hypothetical protein
MEASPRSRPWPAGSAGQGTERYPSAAWVRNSVLPTRPASGSPRAGTRRSRARTPGRPARTRDAGSSAKPTRLTGREARWGCTQTTRGDQRSREFLKNPRQESQVRFTPRAVADRQRGRGVERSEQEGQGDGVGRIDVPDFQVKAQRWGFPGLVRIETVQPDRAVEPYREGQQRGRRRIAGGDPLEVQVIDERGDRQQQRDAKGRTRGRVVWTQGCLVSLESTGSPYLIWTSLLNCL